MTATVTSGLVGQDLARAVIEIVENYPETHYQGDVTCGTTACLAGWTVARHLGSQPHDNLDDVYMSTGWRELRALGDSDTAAADLLGVDPGEFTREVFCEQDRDTAIANFKRLTGIA